MFTQEKKMTEHAQYTSNSGELCRFWSAHVDALDRHLSANMWALAAVTVVVIVYPIARMVIPAVLHGIVPDVVRTVLNLI
jgi:hypothetical protein